MHQKYLLGPVNCKIFSTLSRFYERFPGDTDAAEDQATLFFTLLANEVKKLEVSHQTISDVDNRCTMIERDDARWLWLASSCSIIVYLFYIIDAPNHIITTRQAIHIFI